MTGIRSDSYTGERIHVLQIAPQQDQFAVMKSSDKDMAVDGSDHTCHSRQRLGPLVSFTLDYEPCGSNL